MNPQEMAALAKVALVLKDIVSPIAALLTPVVLAAVGYWLALRQLRKKAAMDIREDLRKRQADALQSAWALLECLTEVDNQHSLVRAERTQRAGGKTHKQEAAERQAAQAAGAALPVAAPAVSYRIHLPNAQAFVFERLPSAFYASGAGLHWPKAVKDLLFEARNIVYGYLLSEHAAHAPKPTAASEDPTQLADADRNNVLRPVNKPELAERLQAIYQELNECLRKEIQAVYDQPKP